MLKEFTSEQLEVQRTIREFVRKELIPIAHDADEMEEFPIEIFRALGKMGFIGMTIPTLYGGAGSDLLSLCIAAEEISYGCSGTALSWGAHNSLCMDAIFRHGTDEQKQRYLPKLCTGEWIGAFALTEPDAGSDAANIKTTAIRDGDYWILNGAKIFITNAPIADIFVVIAVTDKDSDCRKKMSAFIVERDTQGFSTGPKLKKMGMRASPTSEVFLNNCRVHNSSLLDKPGNGFNLALSSIENERALSAALCVGIGRRALDECIRYGKERIQFGKPIASFQEVQYMLSEMAAGIHAARCMMYDIIARKERGEKISFHASMVKLFCAQRLTRITLDAIQIHGGYGYTREFPVERLHRDAKLLEIGGGTNEIQRIIISKHLMEVCNV